MFTRLPLNFSLVFDGIIWKMVVDEQNKLLIFEIRDDKRRKVTFSTFQMDSQNFLIENLGIHEPWWISLVDIVDSVALLQRFSGSENPDRKSLLAMNAKTGDILWEVNDFTFQKRLKNGLLGVLGFEAPQLAGLDLHNGTVLEKWNDELIEEDSIVLPVQYLEGTSYFDSVQEFLVEKLKVEIVLGAEYAEHNKTIIISYNKQENKGLANYLLILNDSGEIVLHEKIAEGIKGLGLDTFFILFGCLFFVRNRSELLSYQL